jgi:hypothetical protein
MDDVHGFPRLLRGETDMSFPCTDAGGAYKSHEHIGEVVEKGWQGHGANYFKLGGLVHSGLSCEAQSRLAPANRPRGRPHIGGGVGCRGGVVWRPSRGRGPGAGLQKCGENGESGRW